MARVVKLTKKMKATKKTAGVAQPKRLSATGLRKNTAAGAYTADALRRVGLTNNVAQKAKTATVIPIQNGMR